MTCPIHFKPLISSVGCEDCMAGPSTPTVTVEELKINKLQERIDRLERVTKLMEEQIIKLNRDMFYLKGQHGKC